MTELSFNRRKAEIAPLNIAPLIDIVFLLIVFFILTSHFVSDTGLRLDLPEAESSEKSSDDRFTVSIDKDANIYFNGEVLSLDLLCKEVEELKMHSLVFKADRDLDLGFVVKAIDAVKRVGAESVLISTEVVKDA